MSLIKPLDRLISFWALAGGFMLLLIVVITAVNAAGFSLNALARLWGGNISGLPGYEDAVTLFVGAAALAMFPYCQRHSGHAVVDVFMQKAPQAFNKFIQYLSALLTILFCIFIVYMLFQGIDQLKSDNVETTVLGWPVWIFASTGIFSCILWALATVVQLLEQQNQLPTSAEEQQS